MPCWLSRCRRCLLYFRLPPIDFFFSDFYAPPTPPAAILRQRCAPARYVIAIIITLMLRFDDAATLPMRLRHAARDAAFRASAPCHADAMPDFRVPRVTRDAPI